MVWLRNFRGFEFDLRPSEVNTSQKHFCCLKAHIIISYLTSIDTFYLEVLLRRSTSKCRVFLSRTVFEICDLKVFRVRPLTFRSYRKSKLFSPFESPYMNSYLLTLLLTLPLYLISFLGHSTCFWMFDLDLQPLDITWGQNCFIIWKPIHFHRHFFSISYVFEIFDVKVFVVRPWPLTSKGHLRSILLYHSEAHVFDFYGHHLSISYCSRDIRFQSF